MVQDDVASVFVPFHLSDKFITGARSGLADGENEDRADHPNSQPKTGKDISEDGQEIDSQIIHNVLCCGLVNCDSNADSVPAAAYAAEVKSGNAPNAIGGVLDPVAIVTSLFILFVQHVNICTTTDQSNLEQDD